MLAIMLPIFKMLVLKTNIHCCTLALDLQYYTHVHWQELEALVDEGKIKAIGVSNFNSKQIARILSEARHPIATNQVECHAYLQQDQLLDFCTQRGIYLTAFSPLGSPGTK